MAKKFHSPFSNYIGIDLGTANTLLYLRGKGIIINEPSVVALNQKTGQVVAVGKEAKDMLGRTPAHIRAVRPLVDGVISDFEVTEEMLGYLIRKAEEGSKKWFGPRVVVGVPSGTTNVERRAVRDAAKSAGAREVYVVEEPMAGAIGINLPIMDPIGSMVVDIGGGTTDIAVISLGGIVQSKNLKVAGDKLNNDIISYMRSEFKLLIGEKTAEYVKIAIGGTIAGESMNLNVRGRDLATGLPREVNVSDEDIRIAFLPSIDSLIEGVREVLETTPPEILADVMQRGVYLIGGGALIKGLRQVLEEYLGIPVTIGENPLEAVVRGCGMILDNLDMYKEVLINNEDELPFKK
jgi:rod shape-determining protein MreB